MPSIPPTTLPSNEVRENESVPTREGIYPPAKEPMIIPNIIIDFRDMVVSKTDVHFHELLAIRKLHKFIVPGAGYPVENGIIASMIIV
ncbi:MAG: hypothetical protein H8E10_00995 [Desulfobacterales bacterium]|nr:hypothetical protein [Desulfobacterales bacterium]